MDKLTAYKKFIEKCTKSPKSVNNYTDFKKINMWINIVEPNLTDILSIDSSSVAVKILEKLLEIETMPGEKQGVSFKSAGNAQYYNAFTTYIMFLNALELSNELLNKKTETTPSKNNQNKNLAFQQIFYGAPGTGKSHGIDVETKGQTVIRTTFHPDSDYSTFVGAYKPVMREVPTMTVIGTKSVAVEDGKGEPVVEKRIEYDFIPQAFTEAYVEAWKDLKKPVYLVIEEINRGNCAQIFGDIFQLLDRNENGYSSYMITPDEDLHHHLEEKFAKDGFDEDCCLTKDEILEVWEGRKMCLPPNLYIWATMNTSDQSLFPIDSAFKRRWDWKYTPISDAGKGYHIDVNGNSYDWWSFLKKVNDIVEEMTSSEDKQLGYFFCKAEDGKISAEKFVGKVIFYLWNDVFKDYGFDRDEFKYEEDGKTKPMTFRKFFKADGKINEVMAEKFLLNLGLKAIEKTEQAISQEEELALEEEDGQKEGKHDFIKAVTLNGERISIDDKTHFDVYLETVRRIGIAEAAPLIESCKYKRKKCPLASTVKYDAIENAPNYSYVEEGGFYFVKGAADKTLINVLNMLKQELSLDMEIEIYR